MTTLLPVLILFLLLGGVTALLERTHRRASALPRPPLGADVRCDVDLWRLRHDLDATRPSR